jgi:hypothetical protein
MCGRRGAGFRADCQRSMQDVGGGAPLGAIGRSERSRRRDGDRLAPPLLRTGVRFPGASEVPGYGLTSPPSDRPHGRRGGADSTRKSDRPINARLETRMVVVMTMRGWSTMSGSSAGRVAATSAASIPVDAVLQGSRLSGKSIKDPRKSLGPIRRGSGGLSSGIVGCRDARVLQSCPG